MLSLLTDFVHNFIVIHLLKIAIFLDVDLNMGIGNKSPTASKQVILKNSKVVRRFENWKIGMAEKSTKKDYSTNHWY